MTVKIIVCGNFRGIVMLEFLERGNYVNSEKYVGTQKNLKRQLRRIHQHDNRWPHRNQRKRTALEKLGLYHHFTAQILRLAIFSISEV